MSDSNPDLDRRPLTQHGTAGEALKLALVNLLLGVLTLFFWRFWGKTRVRRFLWSQTTAWGEPLEYTGRGGELFVGFLIVGVTVFAPLAAGLVLANSLLRAHDPLGPVLVLALQLATVFLAGAGLYRARRYQLSRTLLCGLRAGLDGQAWEYGLMTVAIIAGCGATLGWLWPWGEMRLARYAMANTMYGDRHFICEARSGPVYRHFAVFWLGTALLSALAVALFGAAFATFGPLRLAAPLPLAALSVAVLLPVGGVVATLWARYRAAHFRALAAGTRFGDVAFALEAGGWATLRLGLGNLAITVLTLGAARPWAALRTFRFVCDRLRVDGRPDFAAIHQSSQARPRWGEGLAAVFDGAGEF